MRAPIDAATIRAAPKVLLHDHLDGGLRPTTVLELADEIGWPLPASDPAPGSVRAKEPSHSPAAIFGR